MKKEGEQSYYISQLVQLSLLAFRKDWSDAFIYAGYSEGDAIVFSEAINRLGIIKFVLEYDMQSNLLDTELFNATINYLIRKFDL